MATTTSIQYHRILVTNIPTSVKEDALKFFLEKDVFGPIVINIRPTKVEDMDTYSAVVILSRSSNIDEILKRKPELFGRNLCFTQLYTEVSTLTLRCYSEKYLQDLNARAKKWNVETKMSGNEITVTGHTMQLTWFQEDFDATITCNVQNHLCVPIPLEKDEPSISVDTDVNSTVVSYNTPSDGSASSGNATNPSKGDMYMQSYLSMDQDVLCILGKIKEGAIEGVHYNPVEGKVDIRSTSQQDLSDRISLFQSIYQTTLKRMKSVTFKVPKLISEAHIREVVLVLDSQHDQTYFFYESDDPHNIVKVISASGRQLDSAMQSLKEKLKSSTPKSAKCLGVSKPKFATMFQKLPSGRVLYLKKGNIALEEVNIIVNASNGKLKHEGGVARAINEASNGFIQKRSNQVMAERSRDAKVGELVVTKTGSSLKCQYVIHAVGPRYAQHGAQCDDLLRNMVHDILSEADRLRAKSIAIPAISSGIFGVPNDVVAKCVIQSIIRYDHIPMECLSEIKIVIIDEHTLSVFASQFNVECELIKQAKGYRHLGSQQWEVILSTTEKYSKLCEIMRSMAPCWKNIGREMKFTPVELKSIEDAQPKMTATHTVEITCLENLLFKWQTRESTLATMNELVVILNKQGENGKLVATNIIRAFSGGQSIGAGRNSSPFPNVGNTKELYPTKTERDMAEVCAICQETPVASETTRCGHEFCKKCIQKALQYNPYCPSCKTPLRTITGCQPYNGTMKMKILDKNLPGYQGYKTIEIDYFIPSGIQDRHHPNPGTPYPRMTRHAFLPDNDEGREVYELLKKAFNARLIFTVGKSHTTGKENSVVWSDIHHKTSISGGSYGYPDETYLQRVKDDLAAKGIVSNKV